MAESSKQDAEPLTEDEIRQFAYVFGGLELPRKVLTELRRLQTRVKGFEEREARMAREVIMYDRVRRP